MRLSFSQWENYSQCPRRWRFSYIDKLPRTPIGEAGQRGLRHHDHVENYVKGVTTLLPIATAHDSVLHGLRNATGPKYTEFRNYFDEDWVRTDGEASTAAWVTILDAALEHPDHVEVFEWKTGKPKPSHRDQRHIYGLSAFRIWGKPTVTVTTYYLDGTEAPQKLTIQETAVPKMIKVWKDRRDLMMADTFHPPRPGFHCRWCDFSKDKGGPCPMSG